jgi:hypothetical protein
VEDFEEEVDLDDEVQRILSTLGGILNPKGALK